MTPIVFICSGRNALLCAYNNNYNFCHIQWAVSPLKMTHSSEQGSAANASQLCSMHLWFFFFFCMTTLRQLLLWLPVVPLISFHTFRKVLRRSFRVHPLVLCYTTFLPFRNQKCCLPTNPKHAPRICCWVSQVLLLLLLIIFFYNLSLRKLLIMCLPALSPAVFQTWSTELRR